VGLRFGYVARDDAVTRRHAEPSAVVHSGWRWYLVAYDLEREDWRTFRVDRITGRVTLGARGTRRSVPGGDPAAFVARSMRARDADPVPGRVRIRAPAERVAPRTPARYATVDSDGADACLVTTVRGWSTSFLVWMATLDVELEVLDPPELAEQATAIAARLTAAGQR